MKTTFHDAKEALQKDAVARYGDLLKTTVSLAFGGLVFLLAFEKDYAAPDKPFYWLVYAAWMVMSLSSLAGLYSLILWAERPSRRLSEARIESVQVSGGAQPAIVIPKDVSRREEWTFRIHVWSFVGSIILLIAFKAARYSA
jgi:hypothetical protein